MNAQLPLSLTFDPRHVVLHSGGHGSALASIEVARRYGTNGLVLLNHDISSRSEDADVKRFKREVADYIGVPITYANHPRWDEWDQFDVMVDAGAFKVGSGSELCTSRLKTEPFDGWLSANAPPGTVTLHYGFDSAEMHRIQRRSSILGARGYATDYPLIWQPRTILSTREVGIEPPLGYSTFKHANCVGCAKAGKQHWYVVFCTRPDVWGKATWAEEMIGYTIINGTSLSELEPLFTAMRDAGIEPTEHVPQQRFWRDAKARVRLAVVARTADDESVRKPCDCAYRRKNHGRPLHHCTCGTATRTHTLACIFAAADDARAA